MVYCARCGKELNWPERNTVYWNDQLKNGYIKPILGFPNSGIKIELPNYKGKKICQSCVRNIASNPQQENLRNCKTNSKKKRTCFDCFYSEEITLSVEKASLTNLLGEFAGVGSIEYEYIDKYRCKKFQFGMTNKLEFAETCTSYITPEDYAQKCIRGEMNNDKSRVQIILDFSSLKDEMVKGGVIMTTCKCPNCSAMVNIPETGKILICSHCGTTIKPVDIFEKIKSLICETSKKEETRSESNKDYESENQRMQTEQEIENKPAWFKEALEQHDY